MDATTVRLLDDLKRKREEHAALTTQEQQNIHAARDQLEKKIKTEEVRMKAAWDEIAKIRLQLSAAKADADLKARELAQWQRRVEQKEMANRDTEARLDSRGNEAEERIKKLKIEMQAGVVKIREDLEKVSQLLEQCEFQIRLL